MRLFPQAVDDQHLDAADHLHHRRGHRLAIAQVGQQPPATPREEITLRHDRPVRDRQRRDGQTAELERAGHRMRNHMHVARHRLLRIEGVVEDALDARQRLNRTVDRHRAAKQIAEAAQIVEAHDVVGMRVGEQHGGRHGRASRAAPAGAGRAAWSTSSRAVGVRRKMEERVRLSRGSSDWQTGQVQPIIGTPCEVPEPRMVTISFASGIDQPSLSRRSRISRPNREYLVFRRSRPTIGR